MAQNLKGLASKPDLCLAPPNLFIHWIEAKKPERVMLVIGHNGCFYEISDKLNRTYEMDPKPIESTVEAIFYLLRL